MIPAAAARVRVGVSRDNASGLSLIIRPGECGPAGLDGGSWCVALRRLPRLSDADRLFRAFIEPVGDGRPEVGGRKPLSSAAPLSASSNIVNSASVISALKRLLTGATIVFAECEDSAKETGRGDRLPERAPGRMVLWLAIVESLFRQSSLVFSFSCTAAALSVATAEAGTSRPSRKRRCSGGDREDAEGPGMGAAKVGCASLAGVVGGANDGPRCPGDTDAGFGGGDGGTGDEDLPALGCWADLFPPNTFWRFRSCPPNPRDGGRSNLSSPRSGMADGGGADADFSIR